MADERYTFAQARTRLEEIVLQVRKKDCSLEKSLDLLEEGVRLANTCTELSDHSEWQKVAEERNSEVVDGSDGDGTAGDESDDAAGTTPTPVDAAGETHAVAEEAEEAEEAASGDAEGSHPA